MVSNAGATRARTQHHASVLRMRPSPRLPAVRAVRTVPRAAGVGRDLCGVLPLAAQAPRTPVRPLDRRVHQHRRRHLDHRRPVRPAGRRIHSGGNADADLHGSRGRQRNGCRARTTRLGLDAAPAHRPGPSQSGRCAAARRRPNRGCRRGGRRRGPSQRGRRDRERHHHAVRAVLFFPRRRRHHEPAAPRAAVRRLLS